MGEFGEMVANLSLQCLFTASRNNSGVQRGSNRSSLFKYCQQMQAPRRRAIPEASAWLNVACCVQEAEAAENKVVAVQFLWLLILREDSTSPGQLGLAEAESSDKDPKVSIQ